MCDGIIAPGFEPEALEMLRAKKKGAFIVLQAEEGFVPPIAELREVYGVTFQQKRNDALFTTGHLEKVVVGPVLPADAVRDLVLASIAVKYTQSNSVGYAKNGQMVGVGAGQQVRQCSGYSAVRVGYGQATSGSYRIVWYLIVSYGSE